MNGLNVVEPQLDTARVAAVAHLVGREKLTEMLDLLAGRLTSLAEGGRALPTAEAIRLVHQSQGSAGSLGMFGLQRALCVLEERLAGVDEGAVQAEITAVRRVFAAERTLLENNHQ